MTQVPNDIVQSPHRIAIIGTGLLGGSFGLACRQHWPSAQVVGWSRSEQSRQQALDCGAVTQIAAERADVYSGADLIVIATPVQQIAAIAIEAAQHAESQSLRPLIMDLGSTKGSIVRQIDQHPIARQCFVGAHPIAGSEKTGAAYARADLFEQRVVVLTPTSCTDETKLKTAQAIWRTLQSTVIEMTPEAHDEALACTSHLPHLMASMLAGLLPKTMEPLVGTGWLDTTRVASGDPELWTSICHENTAAILSQLEAAKDWIERLAGHMQAGQFDQVLKLLSEAKTVRDRIQSQRNGLPVESPK